MTSPTIIKHLYIELPDLNVKNSTTIFLNNLHQELTKTTNIFHLKTIFISNKSLSINKIFFLKQVLLLLQPFTVTVTEYNFELNVNNCDLQLLKLLKKFNISRLIWKVNTFACEFAKNKALPLINKALKLGFINFSIDLQYNLPQQTWTQIVADLQICLSLKTPHISYDSTNCYQNVLIKKKISNFLCQNNYDNYEYYSYATSLRYQSQYIIAYCHLENYYGIGPNAVSYLTNQAGTFLLKNNDDIINLQPQIFALTKQQNFINHLSQGLLLKKGITLQQNDINEHHALLQKLITKKQIKLVKQQIFCTKKGWILLNDVIIDIIDSTII